MRASRRDGRSVYIGCYTVGAGGAGAGISRAGRGVDGALGPPTVVARTPAPSFLTAHPTLPVLYAVNEVSQGQLTAFSVGDVDGDGGELVLLGQWPTGGDSPCHVSVGDGHAYVANYGSGSVAVFPLDDAGVPTGRSDLVAHSGRGPDPKRQEGPHAHMAAAVPGGVITVDLGIDAIIGYRTDLATGRLGPGERVAALPPGFGPRHLVFDPSGGPAGLVHVVGELQAMVVTYRMAVDEPWQEVGRIATTDRPGHNQPSEILVSADGRFLYVANRGPDTIAVFALPDGVPRRVAEVSCGGSWPRHMALFDDALYVANERSDSVTLLRCDPATGVPVPAEVLPTPTPTCVLPA